MNSNEKKFFAGNFFGVFSDLHSTTSNSNLRQNKVKKIASLSLPPSLPSHSLPLLCTHTCKNTEKQYLLHLSLYSVPLSPSHSLSLSLSLSLPSVTWRASALLLHVDEIGDGGSMPDSPFDPPKPLEAVGPNYGEKEKKWQTLRSYFLFHFIFVAFVPPSAATTFEVASKLQRRFAPTFAVRNIYRRK